MYLAHFNIKERPFALSTDPRFLWIGANHRQALATLRYGLEENRGIVLLGGEFGAGKTTLINAFAKELDDDVLVGRLSEPGPSQADFFKDLSRCFGLKPDIAQREELIAALTRLVHDRQGRPQRWLLIIDEAQGLSAEVLEEVLELAQLADRGRRRFHIILVGQNEVYQWMAGSVREAFIEQVSATCKIHPLSAGETAAYIDHRLNIAGAGRTPFTEDAIQAIHAFSRGIPRTINLICDFALLHAHLEDADQVDSRMVSASKDRFQIVNLPAAPPDEAIEMDLSPLVADARPSRPTRFWRSMRLSAVWLLVLVVGGYLAYDDGRLDPLTRQAQILRQYVLPPTPLKPSPIEAPATAAMPAPVLESDPSPNPLPAARPPQTEAPAAQIPPSASEMPPPPESVTVMIATPAPTPQDTAPPRLPAPDADRPPEPESLSVSKPPPAFALPSMPTAPTGDDDLLPRSADGGPEAAPAADPADIIDWLIRKKEGGEAPTASPSEQPPR
ncbi:MAG: AAA family ATPase [Desulfobacterales bacterium]|jgi:type II secretory pathway predicted ATPase ExeA